MDQAGNASPLAVNGTETGGVIAYYCDGGGAEGCGSHSSCHPVAMPLALVAALVIEEVVARVVLTFAGLRFPAVGTCACTHLAATVVMV